MRKIWLAALVALAGIVLGLVGCGGNGDDEQVGEGGRQRPSQVTVGLVPVATVAPVYLGIQNGFFEEEGLEVKPRISSGGAELVPAVLADESQFAFSNTVSLLIAAAKGLPVRIVATASGEAGAGASPDEIQAKLVVRRDGPVDSAKDLEGRRIGVNTLDNIADITTRVALEERGVNLNELRFLEIDFPEMLSALDSGNIDAAFLVEPWETIASQSDKYRVIASPYYDTKPGLTTTAYFTSAEYAQRNPEVVGRFGRAIDRSLRHARENEEEAKRVLPEFTRIPADLIPRISFGAFGAGGVDRESLELLSKHLVRYGIIDEQPDLDQLVLRR
jgi:NitT/TauT family transport system substrate-binding protein